MSDVSRETRPLELLPRAEFLDRRWAYRNGQHATIIGPTGCGKSWLIWELLERSAHDQRPGLVLVKKPKDPLIVNRGRELGYRRVTDWPPPLTDKVRARPPGYLVWPKPNWDPDIDNPIRYGVFRRAMLDSYRKGNRIVVVDDAYGVSEILKLRPVLIEGWTEFRSSGTGLWAAFQKPTHVPLWAFSQVEHLFLFHDPDKRARERFGEIGGVDPQLVQRVVARLARHQCLYIRRDGPRMCVIDVH